MAAQITLQDFIKQSGSARKAADLTGISASTLASLARGGSTASAKTADVLKQYGIDVEPLIVRCQECGGVRCGKYCEGCQSRGQTASFDRASPAEFYRMVVRNMREKGVDSYVIEGILLEARNRGIEVVL